MKKVLLSIVVPVYNTSDLVERCLSSIQKCKYDDIEIIVVDDGSTDNSLEICKRLSSFDKRIKVFSKENGGLSSARNFGINVSKGDYIQFVDSDDSLIGCSIDSIVDFIYNNSFDVCEFGYQTIKNNSIYNVHYPVAVEGRRDLLVVLRKEFFRWYAWKYVFRKSLLVDGGFLFPEKKNYEDVFLIPRILAAADEVAALDLIAYEYRLGRNGAITSKPNLNNELNRLWAINENYHYFKDRIDTELFLEIMNNLSKEYYASLASYHFFNQDERKQLLSELKAKKYFLPYTKNGKQRIVRLAIRMIGLRNTARLLGIRNKIKR